MATSCLRVWFLLFELTTANQTLCQVPCAAYCTVPRQGGRLLSCKGRCRSAPKIHLPHACPRRRSTSRRVASCTYSRSTSSQSQGIYRVRPKTHASWRSSVRLMPPPPTITTERAPGHRALVEIISSEAIPLSDVRGKLSLIHLSLYWFQPK